MYHRTGPASNIDGISVLLIVVEFSNISVRISINLQILGWCNSQTLVRCPKQVPVNQLEDSFVGALGAECEHC